MGFNASKAVTEGFVGLIPDLSNDEYHASLALGSTDLKSALKSLAHFKSNLDGRMEVSSKTQSSFDLGTCAHEAVLEGTNSKFIQGPDVSSKAVKAWKEFVDANPDKIVLTPDEHSRVMQMKAAVMAHPMASALIKGAKVEQSYFCVDHNTGCWIKARPDGIGDDYIFDYKTTGTSAAPKDFQKAIENLGYDISAAHYIEVVAEITKARPKNFYFIVQETKAPFELRVYRASNQMIIGATFIRNNILSRVAKAISSKTYPGYSQDVEEIDLPSWSNRLADEESS